ncbi:hypothetical protein ASPZODRAFT_127727 [Penicilliopsis zonata CBS 506.65]|uniref:Uncharacterized protein n=1 Tax=Penicilliopsis zonata CBS 506.65 TaxID=1073090 RepID=A0A1L9SWW2_9EURO|nr:hypothetical protein ASPZODRAFT_127727 [Penicilliopsis zonata CBS 506.65]OJJ51617.1 hypothetical protein ASPZODRAFT_127727 [Penicilliopsis zonata CBS 506.65]
MSDLVAWLISFSSSLFLVAVLYSSRYLSYCLINVVLATLGNVCPAHRSIRE